MKKSIYALDDIRTLRLEKKSAKYQMKADHINIKANSIRRRTPYSIRAEWYAKRADKKTYNASKVQYKLTKDTLYVELMKQRASKLIELDNAGQYDFVKQLLES